MNKRLFHLLAASKTWFLIQLVQPFWLWIWALLVVFYACNSAKGQSRNDGLTLPTLVTVIPPSPTAAALGRFGEIPISLYTGLPTINIPLYNAKNASGAGAISLALNYRASGIRVDDMGSWVGLGWTLDCGGVVTRTIRGMADEEPKGYLHQGGERVMSYLAGTLSGKEQYAVQTDATLGNLDTEPDIYSFNFAGHSGQFVFDRTGKPVLIPQQNVLIEVRTDTAGFKITTEDGTVYQFLSPESSTTETIPNRKTPEVYTSSWYLTRISPVVGASIQFKYSAPKDVAFPASVSENKKVLVNFSSLTPQPLGRVTTLPSQTNVVVSTITLQQITLSDQTITCFTSNRGDVAGMSKLDSLTITNQTGITVKRFSLRYTLGTGNRVYLTQVQEGRGATASLPPYTFTYDDRLPALYSFQQDHWGYFNRNTAATLLPKTTLRIGDQSAGVNSYDLVIDGADRSPDTVLVKAGTLTRLTYPTGGSTTFTYEANDYGYLRQSPNPLSIITSQKQVFVRAKRTNSQDIVQDSAQFKLSSLQTVSFVITNNKGSDDRQDNYAETNATFKCVTCSVAQNKQLGVFNEQGNGTFTYSRALPPGLYRIYAYYEAHRAVSPGSAAISATFQDSVGVNVNQLSGGLRIRRVVSDPGTGAPPLVKQYSYRLTKDPTRSSGCAASGLPSYQYSYQEIIDNPQAGGSSTTSYYTMLTSANGAQPGLLVGYREVTVSEGNGTENGKTVHTFTSSTLYPDRGDGDTFPYAPNNSFDYKRGKPLEQAWYRKNEERTELVRRTRYAYSLDNTRTALPMQRVPGLRFGYEIQYPGYGTDGGGLNQFAAQTYYHVSEWIYPTTEVERHYSATGDTTAYHQTTVRYRYGNPAHQQLTAREQTTSDGSTIISTYRYPLDFSVPATGTLDAPSQGIQMLVAKHVTAVPLERQQWRRIGTDSALIAAQLTHYAGLQVKQIWQLETPTPLTAVDFTPSAIQPSGFFQQDHRYHSAVIFDQYDSRGNLLQQRRTHAPPSSYLWGYNSTLPLAEIKNASFSEVERKLQALGIRLASLTTETQLREALQRLRQSLPSAQITSYTHKPLIGLSSQTDTTGRTIFYEYDGLSRLIRTRDEQGRILSQQQYHYVGK